MAGDDDAATLDWPPHIRITAYHPTGTCKMGRDKFAVVNAKLSVFGVQDLRVADASIIPTITSSNTNALTTMIDEKLSDMVLASM